MSLFDSLNKRLPQQQSTNQQQMLDQLKRNPASTLKQAGLNIPDDMKNPDQIINYLISSGQIQNTRLQAAQRIMQMFGRR